MRAVTFQSPGEVRVEEKPDPELTAADEAIVRVEATGVCGSDLHLYHGRIEIEPGFTLGHEYVGTVVAAGDDVTGVGEGDRVLGTFLTACGDCFFCRRGDFHKCDKGRVFGHGATLGSLQGAQADLLLVPNANLTLRPVPAGLPDEVALFAGDVMGTGYHAIDALDLEPGGSVAVLGLGPVGLCAIQVAKAAGAAQVIGIDSVEKRLTMAESFGATLGSLAGAQAELLLVPNANLTLRRVPDGLSDEVALFAGDVAATAYHAICGDSARPDPLEPGSAVAVLGLGPVGLCAAQVALACGASAVIGIDSVEKRLAMAESFGATPLHLTEDDPRARVRELTEGRGVDLAVDAVGHTDALDLACRLARKAGTVSVTGVYAERGEVHLGVVWIRSLTLRAGQANAIGHLDRVLTMLSAGRLDPSPLVTHRMSLDDAPEAYAAYDRREALKIVLTP